MPKRIVFPYSTLRREVIHLRYIHQAIDALRDVLKLLSLLKYINDAEAMKRAWLSLINAHSTSA